MTLLTRSFYLALGFLVITSHATVAEQLVVVTEAWAPYVYEDAGVTKGFDFEVMAAVFREMGYTADCRFYPWKRCLRMVRTQEADAILDVSLNPERSKQMFFPEESISESTSVLFFLKGRPDNFSTLSDLAGLKIGTVLGYFYNQAIQDAEYFIKEPVRDIEQNFNKLLAGRIDMFISNKHVGLFNAQKLGLLDRIGYTRKKISGGRNYVAFSLKPDNKDLAMAFSTRLKTFKTTSRYRAIMQKYGQ